MSSTIGSRPILHPFSQDSLAHVHVDIPADLTELIDRSAAVLRFQYAGYPPDLVVDNDKTHTLRLVQKAALLDLPRRVKDRLIRMLFVHDLPEVIIGDVTNVEKDLNPALATKIDADEEKAVATLLSPSDRELIKEFNLAKRFLGEKIHFSPEITEAGILARILDAVDGNMTFHQGTSTWLADGKPSFGTEAITTAFSYTFKQQTTFRDRLHLVPDNLQYIFATIDMLLAEQLDFIKAAWQSVPEDKIPIPVKEALAKL